MFLQEKPELFVEEEIDTDLEMGFHFHGQL